ncbi:unnamed protein product [Cyprideis torosa]|uniref:Uncharacterized protein n=1 Tax=Cyprideis torosa TaxID=163714 RepID=A0A7R8WMC6_9CRUS|nr:unnamed protein product [Cyprideis torosa]CAG0903518.1 unnamed protein product [Cyprideis torosa]
MAATRLDELKASRRSMKGWATRSVNAINALHAAPLIDVDELEVEEQNLRKRQEQLEEVQMQIEALLIDDDALAAEQDESETVMKTIKEARAKCLKTQRLLRAGPGSTASTSMTPGAAATSSDGRDRPTLSCLRLMFEALEYFQRRFGNPELRKDALAMKLLDLEAAEVPDEAKLRHLIDDIVGATRSLEALGRSYKTAEGRTLKNLLTFLEEEVAIMERARTQHGKEKLQCAGLEESYEGHESAHALRVSEKVKGQGMGARGQYNGKGSSSKGPTLCLFCQGSHATKDCAADMTLEEKHGKLVEARIASYFEAASRDVLAPHLIGRRGKTPVVLCRLLHCALHNACSYGHYEVCEVLVRHGAAVNNEADRNRKNRDGKTPLDLVKKGDEEVADLLRGEVALLEASKKGSVSRVKNLITLSPAMINCRDIQGRNSRPLHLAAGYNNLEVAEYLLENGADVNAQDKGGLIHLYNASSYGNLDIAALADGDEPYLKNQEGDAPVDMASAEDFMSFLSDSTQTRMSSATPPVLRYPADKACHYPL